MMVSMDSSLDLASNTFLFVTKSCLLVKRLCLLGARIVGLIALAWLHFVKAVINFHLGLVWRILIWAVAFLSLPVRVLTALQRERVALDSLHLQLEDQLCYVQVRLESLMWEKEELEEHLQAALKEHDILESILAELEEEHDKTLANVEKLEKELHVLKEEYSRLSEIWEKDIMNSNVPDGDPEATIGDVKHRIPLVANSGVSLWNSSFSEDAGVLLEDLLIHEDGWEREHSSELQKSHLLKPGSKTAQTYPFSPRAVSTSFLIEEAPDQRRQIAISQSIFSTILSVLVGMVTWEAKDPCMPLVVALLIVVGISLKSVVHFLSTIKVKPASDVVILLGFNCFILGAITFPTLPAVSHLLVPYFLKLLRGIISGFSFFS